MYFEFYCAVICHESKAFQSFFLSQFVSLSQFGTFPDGDSIADKELLMAVAKIKTWEKLNYYKEKIHWFGEYYGRVDCFVNPPLSSYGEVDIELIWAAYIYLLQSDPIG